MSKHYLSLPPHGLNGDFYRYGDEIFRADNLEIATMIAFNRWLEQFDNLGHECTLKLIGAGEFVVATDTGVVIEDDIEYYGPPDMFTAVFQMAHCDDPEILRMASAMLAALESGHPSVRRSNTSGAVIFTEDVFQRFERWCDGEYISGLNHHLSTDPETARMQMRIAGIEQE